jgi:hypothetical protein
MQKINTSVTKMCSIKKDGKSIESKQINVKVNFVDVDLDDVIQKAISSTIITWQNGHGRKQFDQLVNGQTIEINFGVKIVAVKSKEQQISDMIKMFTKAGLDMESATRLAQVAVNNPNMLKIEKPIDVDEDEINPTKDLDDEQIRNYHRIEEDIDSEEIDLGSYDDKDEQ